VSLAGRAVVLRTEPSSLPSRGLVPGGLPSFPSLRSADAFGPAWRPGLRAALAWARRHLLPRGHWRPLPSSITTSATVARRPVPSRRARPCPRLRLRAAPALALDSLTAPVGALLWSWAMNSGKTVATGPAQVFAPTPPEDPKRAPNL